jgi:hypothetical protein
MDFAQVSNVRVIGNDIGGFFNIKKHPDAIQFMTTGTSASSHHIEIRDNVIMQDSGVQMQGIFMRDELGTRPFRDVAISNNLIFTDQWNGIALFHAENATITNNSVLSSEGDAVVNRIRLSDILYGRLAGNVAEAFILERSGGLSELGNLNLGRNYGNSGPGGGHSGHPNLSGLLFDGIGYSSAPHGSGLAPAQNGDTGGGSGGQSTSQTTAHHPVSEAPVAVFPVAPTTTQPVHLASQKPNIVPEYIETPPSARIGWHLHGLFSPIGEHFAIA